MAKFEICGIQCRKCTTVTIFTYINYLFFLNRLYDYVFFDNLTIYILVCFTSEFGRIRKEQEEQLAKKLKTKLYVYYWLS